MTNVLFIMADDMRYELLRYMRHTRRLLIKEGHSFTTCHLNIGLCQPCRVGVLSGQYSISANNNVLQNNVADLAGGDFDHNNTIGKFMQDAGYETAMIGKYMNATGTFNPKPTGWNTWRQLNTSTQSAYGYRVHNGTTNSIPTEFQLDHLQSEATNFISGATEPWFLYLTPTAPHWPFASKAEHFNKWKNVIWPIVDETDVSDKPSWVQSKAALTTVDKNVIQQVAIGQLQEIYALDEMIKAVIDHIDSLNQLGDTVIIFSSDNGVHYGEHRYTGPATKNTPYEVALHVPLIVRGPGFDAGTTDSPTTNMDITKTCVEIANATPSYALDGIDLRDIAANPSNYANRAILHELSDETWNDDHAAGIGITTKTRKLFRYYASGTDQYEMYHIDTDPDELTNLGNDPGSLTERNQLEAILNSMDTKARNAVINGTSGAYLSTPDSAALSITGDIDVRIKVSLNDWTPSGSATLISKGTSTFNQRSWRVIVATDGKMTFGWSTAGTSYTTATTTAALGFTDKSTHWLRVTMDVDNGAAGRTITFYKADDYTDNPVNLAWTQIEQITQAGVTSIFDSTSILEISGDSAGTLGFFAGRVYAAAVYNGIGGTQVASPRFRLVTRGASSFVDAQGNTWTKNGGVTIE